MTGLKKQPLNMYLSSISHSVLLKSIKNGSRFRLHPYFWNRRSQCMERSSEKRHLAVWCLNAVIPIAYFIFVTLRAIQTFSDKSAPRRDVILGGFGVAFYLFPATFQLMYFFCGDEFPGLINQGLRLLISDSDKSIPPPEGGSSRKLPTEVRIAEFYNCVIYYGFQFLGYLVILFGLTFPGTRFLASSLHENPYDWGNPYRAFSLMFLVYITGNYVISGWLIGVGLATVPFPLCVILDLLSKRPLTSKVVKDYNCLQLWVAKFNRVYSPILLPMAEVLLIVLTTLGIVGVIRFPGVIGLVVGNVGVTTYAILYLLLRFFATIDKNSRTVVERWRFGARGLCARQLRALRPISISIGSYFFIDRCLILTATHLIVTNSIAMLLVE